MPIRLSIIPWKQNGIWSVFFPQAAKKRAFLSYIIIDRIVHGEIEDNNAFLYVGNLEKRKGRISY